MADKKDDSCEKFSLRHSATKRLFTDVGPSDGDGNFLQSSLGQNQDNGSFATKKFKYRDQNTESLDADSLKLAFGSPVLSDSLDSVALLSSYSNHSSSPSSSRNAGFSLPSLELNSIIQKCDMTTLNSLSMSQMSQMSTMFDDATSCSLPQTVDMSSPNASRNVKIASPEQNSPIQNMTMNSSPEQNSPIQSVTMNSISWSQTSMMSICENAMTSPIPQTIEMASFPSHTSPVVVEENSGTCAFEGKFTAGLFNAQSSSSSSTETNNTVNSSPVIDISCSSIHKSECKELSSVSVTKCDKELRCDVTLSSNKSTGRESIQTKRIAIHKAQKDIQEENEKNSKEEDLDSNNDKSWNHDQSSMEKPATDSDCVTKVRHESNTYLKDNFKTCKKNPGHEKFYSPKELKVSDLPKDIQHEDSLTFFQCLSKLVVQISVGSTSSNRSKEDVYSSYIGTNKIRHGSGFYVSTDKHMIKMRCTMKDCPHTVKEDESLNCSDLSVSDKNLKDASSSSPFSQPSSSSSNTNSSSPGKAKRTKRHFIYGGVSVRTNRHVIFDKSEADTATVNFFFHSSNRKEVVTGHVASILGVNNDQDHIILHVMSHNKLLIDMVDFHLKNAKSSYIQMIKSTHITQQNHGLGRMSWVSVISHPHGTASSISFGRLKKEEVETKRVIKYYDAATCPGSSGGLVVTPTLLHLQWPGAVHSSFCKRTKYNVSLDSRFQEFDATVIGQMTKKNINKRESSPENQFKL